MSNNPTAASAIVGDPLQLGRERSWVLMRELLMPLILAGFGTYLLFGIITMRIPEGVAFPGPEFFPAIITVGLYVVAALLALSAVKEWRSSAAAQTEAHDDAPAQVGVDWISFAWIVAGFLAFALLLPWLGWVVDAALLFWCVAWGFGAKRPVFNLFSGLVASSVTYIVFDMLLGLTLPSGILGWGF
ncbi:tripartite tricarboxylate transporter TctB family protein [Microbacterium sp.]|uniref:tripartite tricarboxylate transporter TctB family protein n=1 Tax=Microbacterium sp. TaxID=51671 RepID=UPI0039E2A8F7